MSDLIGRQLGAYRIENRLGEGGIGAVYTARHSRTGKLYAIKVLLEDKTSSAAQDRFQREALALSKLRHPNIVQIHDYNVDDSGMAYLVMDHLVGEDLAERLERQGPLSWKKAYEVFVDVQKALAAAHAEGVLHRDLKPANIFLSNADGERERALVLDFGLAKIMSDADSTKLTQTGATMGTPLYMSPEQARADVLDERTDVYSLGCILFEMLAGTPPFSGSTLSALLLKVMTEPPPMLSVRAPQVSPELDEVLRIAMSKEPQERYPDVAQFRKAVEVATQQWRGLAAPTQSAANVEMGVAHTMASQSSSRPTHRGHSFPGNVSVSNPSTQHSSPSNLGTQPSNPAHAFSRAGQSAPEQGAASYPPTAQPKSNGGRYLLTALVAMLVGLAAIGVWFAYSALQTAKQAAHDNEGLAQELALKSALTNNKPKPKPVVGAPPTVTQLEEQPNPLKVARAEGLIEDKKTKRRHKRKQKRKADAPVTPAPATPTAVSPPAGRTGGETDAEYMARMHAYSQAQYKKSIATIEGYIRSAEDVKRVIKSVRGQVQGGVTTKPKLCSSAAKTKLERSKRSVGSNYESMIDALLRQRSLLCEKYDAWEHPEGTALGLIRRTPTEVAEAQTRLQKAKPEEQAAIGPILNRVGRGIQKPGRFACFLPDIKNLKAKVAEIGHSAAANQLLGHHRRVCSSLRVDQIPGLRKSMNQVLTSYGESMDKMITSQRQTLVTIRRNQEEVRRR